ncbi:hypothetical protein [Thalassotalea euphylliae]|uniref:IPTL-CTERM sorting domain-containing protein n=1 Tax=Thalassotalea euphylliae TaxID=1655234 RepID=A0A3E0U6C0_9GAMM|nr:hypothetical protein [Thalassotalea euphylliae]REL32508.1 hypothetical protein DXX94_18320 [Thalassotalea euphylliae]
MVKLLSVRLSHLLLLFCLLFTASSNAALLFSQDPLTAPSPVASGPISTAGFKLIDNFSLSSDVELTQIDFWTFESIDPLFQTRSNVFDIAIYQDNGNLLVGAPIWSAVVSVFNNEITKVLDPITQLFSHSLSLATPQSLASGNYYFQVAAASNNTIDGSPGPIGALPVGWQSANGVPGAPPALLLSGNQIIPQVPAANMAFSLTGNVVQTIPVPSTLWLMVMVLLSGLFYRGSTKQLYH